MSFGLQVVSGAFKLSNCFYTIATLYYSLMCSISTQSIGGGLGACSLSFFFFFLKACQEY